MLFNFVFCSRMIVHIGEKDEIKYFAKNYLGKIKLFYVQTAA